MYIKLINGYKIKLTYGHERKAKRSPNTAYTLRANALALWDIAVDNVVYAENVMCNAITKVIHYLSYKTIFNWRFLDVPN
jgi:hypothetical protein